MFRNILIALSATATLALAAAPVAEAKTNIDLDFGVVIGGGGVLVAPTAGIYDDDFYVDDDMCGWQTVKRKKWNKAHTKRVVYFTKEWVCG